jgi:predicted glycoside hydrolase/deacetylase ChbG (UPF0249 family)
LRRLALFLNYQVQILSKYYSHEFLVPAHDTHTHTHIYDHSNLYKQKLAREYKLAVKYSNKEKKKNTRKPVFDELRNYIKD